MDPHLFVLEDPNPNLFVFEDPDPHIFGLEDPDLHLFGLLDSVPYYRCNSHLGLGLTLRSGRELFVFFIKCHYFL